MRLAIILFLVGSLLGGESTARAIEDAIPVNPEQILERALRQNFAPNYARVTLENVDTKRGKRRLKGELGVWTVERDNEYCLFGQFFAPTTVRNTTMLVMERAIDGGSNDYWMYLPSIRNRRRISGASRGDAFFGTELSQGDMEFRRGEHFSVLRMEESMLDDEPVYVFVLRPRFASGYDQTTMMIAKSDGALLRVTQEKMQGTELVPVRMIDIGRKNIMAVGGRALPTKLVAWDPKTPERTTEVTWKERVIDPTIRVPVCTQQALQQGRKPPKK